ncbi:MAG: anti-sigma factor family protein [Planctomycetota bacterium]
MKDELLLSLFLDGRLDPAASEALERRLEAEPALRAQLEALRRLQDASAGLEFEGADFTAEEVRVRLGRSARPGRRGPLAAAAILALALTHAAAYTLGNRTEDRVAVRPDPILETERLLARASRLDAGAPHGLLQSELGDLQRDIQLASLPARLATYENGDKGRLRASELADALSQLELVLDRFDDPGFRVMMITGIARESLTGETSLRILPASARSYTRVMPVGGNRFRVYVVDTHDGRVLADEGTLEELRRRHTDVGLKNGD